MKNAAQQVRPRTDEIKNAKLAHSCSIGIRKKARKNVQKQSVSFHDALSIFGDPFAATFADLEHSSLEERFVTFGYSSGGILLAVVHVERGEITRIISARNATPRERRLYEEGK